MFYEEESKTWTCWGMYKTVTGKAASTHAPSHTVRR